jgi:hypothetical protein
VFLPRPTPLSPGYLFWTAMVVMKPLILCTYVTNTT